jgi:hypothetical protein
VLAAGRIPAPAALSRDEALAALARRYFAGHGPATPADLARWANLTVADTKRAVSAARPHLAAMTADGVEYLLSPDTPDQLADCRREAAGVLALPGFDEMIFGYRDRSATLPADRVDRVFPHRNGVPACTIVVKGQVAAIWRHQLRDPDGANEIIPLVPLSEQVVRAAARKASALA